MSRTFWVTVGAVGGIVVYRKGQRALDDARERGLIGNIQIAASTAASVAQGTSRLVGLAAQPGGYDDPSEAQAEAQADRMLRSVQVTPVRRTSLNRRNQRVPATAMRFDALNPEAIIDVREVLTSAAG